MSFNTVFSVVDGRTFEVTPAWRWMDQTGTYVEATGYDPPRMSEEGGREAREKLTNLLLGKQVELRKPQEVRRGILICDVYFAGLCLAEFFPEF
jgi:endonuclease YncB( thermonuclease family)